MYPVCVFILSLVFYLVKWFTVFYKDLCSVGVPYAFSVSLVFYLVKCFILFSYKVFGLLAVPYALIICHAVLSCQVFFMIIFCGRLYALCGVGFPALCWLWCRCGVSSGALICPKVLPELR